MLMVLAPALWPHDDSLGFKVLKSKQRSTLQVICGLKPKTPKNVFHQLWIYNLDLLKRPIAN